MLVVIPIERKAEHALLAPTLESLRRQTVRPWRVAIAGKTDLGGSTLDQMEVFANYLSSQLAAAMNDAIGNCNAPVLIIRPGAILAPAFLESTQRLRGCWRGRVFKLDDDVEWRSLFPVRYLDMMARTSEVKSEAENWFLRFDAGALLALGGFDGHHDMRMIILKDAFLRLSMLHDWHTIERRRPGARVWQLPDVEDDCPGVDSVNWIYASHENRFESPATFLYRNGADDAKSDLDAAPVDIVMAWRDWFPGQLEACVASIQASTAVARVVVVRYGGTMRPPRLSGVQYIDAPDADGPFNRSRALNVGIRATSGRYVITTDPDILFPERLIENALLILEAGPAFLLAGCTRLPPDCRIEIPPPAKYRDYGEPPVYSQGGFQAFRRDWFDRCGGYDEAYTVWGAEDNDMAERAQAAGLPVRWLHKEDPRNTIFHKWHAKQEFDDDELAQIAKNRQRRANKLKEIAADPRAIVRNQGQG